MTQQHLVGEFSVLLAQQIAVTSDPQLRLRIGALRLQAELAAPTALAEMLYSAMILGDASCWNALDHGDTTAFHRQVDAVRELHEFAVCSGLLDEDPTVADRPPDR